MTNKYHNLSIAELYARLDEFLNDDEIAIREGSRVIQAMVARGEKPEIIKAGPFKFWKGICDEVIHPRAALMFSGQPQVMDFMQKIDKDLQEALANGRSIDVAVIDGKGAVTHRSLRVIQIPSKTLSVMVENKKILPVKEQERILLEGYRPRVAPVSLPPAVKANTGSGTISVGQHEVDAIKLAEALKELGFTVTR